MNIPFHNTERVSERVSKYYLSFIKVYDSATSHKPCMG
jgi:hypothetical protein